MKDEIKHELLNVLKKLIFDYENYSFPYFKR